MPRRPRISHRLVPLVLFGSLTVLGVLLAGCGNSRTPVPSLGQPAPPNGTQVLDLPAGGVLVVVPRSWVKVISHGPLLATIASGSAVIAIWSYHRAAPPPVGPRALARARAGLLAAARRRDPRLELIHDAVIRLEGRPAVELDALEQVKGRFRRVRSVHVYGPGREIVLDAYAPPSVFHPLDHAVFSPVKRSLRFHEPGAA